MTDRIGNMTKTGHDPSDAEKQEVVAATGRQNQRPPRVAIDIRQPENAAVEISPTHSDGPGWQTRLKDALGTSSNRFVDVELARLMTIFRDRAGVIDADAVNAALAVIDGLKPQNEIEAALAVQIAVTHALVMKFSARLYSGSIETIPQQDSAALIFSPTAGIHHPNGFPVEYAPRRTAKNGGRTCPRLPGRTSNRRQCDPSREGGIR